MHRVTDVPCLELTDDGARPGKTARSREAFARHIAQRVAYAHGWRTAAQGARFLGSGLTYLTWFVSLGATELAVRVPHVTAENDQPERARRVAQTLSYLLGLDFPHALPRPLALVGAGARRTIVVQSFVPGGSVGRAGALRVDPADVLARAAAACHGAAVGPLVDVLPTFGHCGEHGLIELEVFDDDSDVVRDALAWCHAHMPPAQLSRLVHGDLVGQNVHAFDDGAGHTRFGVLDWENAFVGDPAYDVAVITRGKRHPFGKGRGNVHRVLETYNEHARAPLPLARVRFYEACIQANDVGLADGRADLIERRRALGEWLRRVDEDP